PRPDGAAAHDAAGRALARSLAPARQGDLRDHRAHQPGARGDGPPGGAERQHGAPHRRLRLRARGRPHRDGGHLRAAARERGHQGILPRHERIGRPRYAALEEEEDMAVTTETATTVFGQDTLPKLFRHVVRERGDRVAMREKDLGVWRAVSWREYGERAKHVGLGLVALGLRPRDVVSIMAVNCPDWLYTDLGTLS